MLKFCFFELASGNASNSFLVLEVCGLNGCCVGQLDWFGVGDGLVGWIGAVGGDFELESRFLIQFDFKRGVVEHCCVCFELGRIQDDRGAVESEFENGQRGFGVESRNGGVGQFLLDHSLALAPQESGALHLVAESWQVDGVGHLGVGKNDINLVSLGGGFCTDEVFEGARGCAVDGVGVDFHPIADSFESVDRFLWEGAIGFGADVEEEISTFADDVDKHVNEIGGGLPVFVSFVPSPVPIHGDAAFPGDAGNALGGDFLFRRSIVSGVASVRETSHASASNIDAVVDDYVWLEFAAKIVEFLSAGVVPSRFPFAIEPHHRDGAVVCEEFGDLVFEILVVSVKVGASGGPIFLPIAAREVVGVVPVHDGVVPAHFESVCADSLAKFCHDVAFERGGVYIEVGDFAFEEVEAVVVFGGDDDVLHSGVFGHLCPGVGIELCRVKLVDELVVLFERDLGSCTNPLCVVGAVSVLSFEDAIESPVDEHAELIVMKPVESRVFSLGHGDRKGGNGRCEHGLSLA